MNTDKLCHNQDEAMEHIMLFAPMDTLFAIQDAYQQSIASDRHMDWAEEDAESVPVRKSGKSRHDKKASRRKGSAKRFRDRSRKCASEGHMCSVYFHGKKQSRTQSVNIHFTDGVPQDVYDLTEADVHEWYSVSTWDGYESMEDFFQYMDNMDWEKIPTEVRFSVEWYAENPFTADFPEPEWFRMDATLRRTQKTLSAEKAKEEYLKFKKRYQVFHKYAKKLRSLYEEMNTELRA